jgi:hypothetical protein
MPSNFLVTLENLSFPPNQRYSFRELCQSVFDRYYQTYIARLSKAGYTFPPQPYYLSHFGHHIPALFICNWKEGLVFDPGAKERCLVFLNDGDMSVVRVYIARAVSHREDELILFGESAYGIRVSLENDTTAAVVAVPLGSVETLTSEGVTCL